MPPLNLLLYWEGDVRQLVLQRSRRWRGTDPLSLGRGRPCAHWPCSAVPESLPNVAVLQGDPRAALGLPSIEFSRKLRGYWMVISRLGNLPGSSQRPETYAWGSGMGSTAGGSGPPAAPPSFLPPSLPSRSLPSRPLSCQQAEGPEVTSCGKSWSSAPGSSSRPVPPLVASRLCPGWGHVFPRHPAGCAERCPRADACDQWLREGGTPRPGEGS